MYTICSLVQYRYYTLAVTPSAGTVFFRTDCPDGICIHCLVVYYTTIKYTFYCVIRSVARPIQRRISQYHPFKFRLQISSVTKSADSLPWWRKRFFIARRSSIYAHNVWSLHVHLCEARIHQSPVHHKTTICSCYHFQDQTNFSWLDHERL